MEDKDKLYLIEQLENGNLLKEDALDWIAFLSSKYGVSRRGNTENDVIKWIEIKKDEIIKLTNNKTIDYFPYNLLLLKVDGLYNQTESQKAKRADADKMTPVERAAAQKAAANLATLLRQGEGRWGEGKLGEQ